MTQRGRLHKAGSLKETLAIAVKDARTSRELTQAAVAGSAGTSVATVNEVEAGKGNPTLGTIDRIADVLGLEVEIRVEAA